jgi:hypothetical protein
MIWNYADALSARTRPANSLSRVVRRSEPRTTQSFLLWGPDRPHGYLAEKRGTLDPLQRLPYASARIRICRAAQKQPHAYRWRMCVKASDRWPQANVVADPCCREAASEHR